MGYSGRSASEEDALCTGSHSKGLQGGGGLGPKTGAGHPSNTERETSTNSAKDESVGHTCRTGREAQRRRTCRSTVCSAERETEESAGRLLWQGGLLPGRTRTRIRGGWAVRVTPGSSEQPTGTGKGQPAAAASCSQLAASSFLPPPTPPTSSHPHSVTRHWTCRYGHGDTDTDTDPDPHLTNPLHSICKGASVRRGRSSAWT